MALHLRDEGKHFENGDFRKRCSHNDHVIGLRAFFARGRGGAVNHLPKKFLQVAQIFTKQSKWVIRCTNNGLHTK